MSAGLGESAPYTPRGHPLHGGPPVGHIPYGQIRGRQPYADNRDLTPFRKPLIRTPVRGLTSNVGEVVTGLMAGRLPGTLAAEGGVPRLGRVAGRVPGKTTKAVHSAVFGSTEPDRLI